MKWNRIARGWRRNIIEKLQDQYGLSETEARQKANLWLDWVKEQGSQPVPVPGIKPVRSRREVQHRSLATAAH